MKELTEFTRIKYLPLDKVHLLKEEQLEEFEYGDYSKEFVEHLSDHGIKALNKPDLCALAEHLTDHHLKISMTNKITSLKIIYNTTPKSPRLNTPKISLTQVKTSDSDLFRLTAPHLIQELDKTQLSKINDDSIQNIKASQLKDIEKLIFNAS